MSSFEGIPGGDLIANEMVKKNARDELIEYKKSMEKKIQIIESVLERNDGVYDKKTLQYCINTLRSERNQEEDKE